MNMAAWTRITVLLAAIGLTAGCEPAPTPTIDMKITGEIRVPPGTAPGAKVYVSLYYAWSLQGELRHPLQLIESFEASPGEFTRQLAYSPAGGEGLIVYAWVDLDGDTVLCTPGDRKDLAGLTEAGGLPVDQVRVIVNLTEPCAGPDWFFPAGRFTGPGGL